MNTVRLLPRFPFPIVLIFFSTLQAQSIGGWKLDWSEEFNDSAINPGTWSYENGYVRNNEAQYYTQRPDNARIENGNLLIQALQDNWNGHEYTSASLTTQGKKSFRFGRFEMRAQIDIRLGSWPAWWWLPNSGGWPQGGEIDMMEYYQGKTLLNVMNGNQQWVSVTQKVDSAWAADYHTWTMDWDSTKIDLYLDGVLKNHYLLSVADGTGPNGGNPFLQPGYMIVNQAIGGNSGGDPSGTVFPVNYNIDWIRVHTWSDETAYTLTVNGGVGGGPYVLGAKASITANPPPAGQTFDRWVSNSGNPNIDFPDAASATLVMPVSNVTVTATYRSAVGILSHRSINWSAGGKFSVYNALGEIIIPENGMEKGPAIPAGIYFVVPKNSVAWWVPHPGSP